MSSPEQPSPPAGWYPDAERPGAERWWDGAQWTAYERPIGAPGQLQAGGPMSQADEQTWAALAHVSALLAGIAGLAFLGPLVVYLIKKDESPFVRAHAVAALNFQLSWLIWGVALGIATFVLLLVFIGILLVPVLIVGAIAWVVLVVLATIRASKHEPAKKYPLTIDFVS